MRFFDKGTLLGKVQENTGVRLQRVAGQTPTTLCHYILSASYLALIYQRVAEDVKSAPWLKAFAKMDQTTLEHVDMILVFWWFYSQDRLMQKVQFEDIHVRKCFGVWGMTDQLVNRMRDTFDELGDGEKATHLVELLQASADDRSLSPLWMLPHIRHAQVTVLADPEHYIEQSVA